jgi:lysophospholipase L1-like esterase
MPASARIFGAAGRRNSHMVNRWWWRVAFIGLALVLATEVGLRFTLGLGHPLLVAPGAGYGYLPQPNQDLHRFFHQVQTNSMSMRSPEVTLEKPRGSKRVLFIGDSITFGTTSVDQADIFTSVIEHDLKSPGADVQILNASAGGWAPANERGFLQARGTYGADMVVSVINTQDLTQSFADFQPSIIYPTANPPSAIWELLRRYIAPTLFPQLRVRDPGSDGQGDPPVEAKTPVTLDVLSDMRRQAQAAGASYVIVYVPTASTGQGPYHEHWQKGLDMLKAWTQSQNVPLIDLSEVFARKASTDIFLDGTHLKPAGNRLVAVQFEEFFEHLPATP